MDHCCSAATASGTSGRESSRERVRHLVAKRWHEHDVWFGTPCAVTTGTVKPCAVRMRRRTPTSVSSMCAGACGSEPCHRIGQAHCVSERRKPQIKHAITNKDVEFHGNNDINVVIIAYEMSVMKT